MHLGFFHSRVAAHHCFAVCRDPLELREPGFVEVNKPVKWINESWLQQREREGERECKRAGEGGGGTTSPLRAKALTSIKEHQAKSRSLSATRSNTYLSEPFFLLLTVHRIILEMGLMKLIFVVIIMNLD